MPVQLDLRRLPIVVAVTGHRQLRPGDVPALETAVDGIFAELGRTYPSTPLLLLTPLAEGAEQLVARVARRRAVPYRVPIPLPLDEYRADFADADGWAAFEELLGAAESAPYEVPPAPADAAGAVAGEVRRARRYAALAAHLAQIAHVFIALWDGAPSDAAGGTAQAVRFRVLGVPPRYRRASLIDEPETGAVYQVYAARPSAIAEAQTPGRRTLRVRRAAPPAGAARPASLAEEFAAIDELPAGAPDPFATLFGRIEAFNADCVSGEPAPAASATAALMAAAERAATFYARKYVRALQLIYGATGIGVIAFLLYTDVAERAHPIVMLYLAASCLAVGVYAAAHRGRWQDRAQDYRALEIGLHVQHVWDAAGLDVNVADYYIRRQRTELDWIRNAIRTAHEIDRQRPADDARAISAVRDFVLRQYAYFAGTAADPRLAAFADGATFAGGAEREHRKGRLHARVNAAAVRFSFVCSALLIAYAVVAWFAPERLGPLADESGWHGYLTFLIGAAAAVAALVHDYSERRGHEQHERRYALMASMYRRALDALDDAADRSAWRDPDDGPPPAAADTARACILDLGLEALTENGDWLLMHRELPLQLLSLH